MNKLFVKKKLRFNIYFQGAYNRIAVDSEVIKSIADSDNLENSSFSSDSQQPHSDNHLTVQSLQQHQRRTPMDRSQMAISQTESGPMHTSRHTVASNATDMNAASSLVDQSNVSQTLISESPIPASCNLAMFLIQRACRNPTLSNYLYWYLYIECESHDTVRKQDEKVKHMYDTVLKIFKRTLMSNPELKIIKINLEKQQLFIDELVKLVKNVAKESGNRKKKCEKFQQLLADSDAFRINFSNFDAIPLPLDPEVVVRGIVPMKVSLFKSALMPAKYDDLIYLFIHSLLFN